MNPAAAVQKYDLTPAQDGALVAIETRVPGAVTAAEEIRVTDDRTDGLAVNARTILKTHEKELEERRLAIVEPHKKFAASVDRRCKVIADAIAKAVKHLDGQMLSFRSEKKRLAEEARRRQEEEQRRAADEAAEKARQEAEAAGMTKADAGELGSLIGQDAAQEVAAAQEPVLAPPRTTHTGFGSATEQSVLDFEVTDAAALIAALPEAYELKRGKVLEARRTREKAGLSLSIPGVRFFKTERIAGR